jgi:hypothetical protein
MVGQAGGDETRRFRMWIALNCGFFAYRLTSDDERLNPNRPGSITSSKPADRDVFRAKGPIDLLAKRYSAIRSDSGSLKSGRSGCNSRMRCFGF